MSTALCKKHLGRILAVHHETHRCRLEIELSESLEVTAGLMKESLVELEVLDPGDRAVRLGMTLPGRPGT